VKGKVDNHNMIDENLLISFASILLPGLIGGEGKGALSGYGCKWAQSNTLCLSEAFM